MSNANELSSTAPLVPALVLSSQETPVPRRSSVPVTLQQASAATQAGQIEVFAQTIEETIPNIEGMVLKMNG
jgi:hypothetical protein